MATDPQQSLSAQQTAVPEPATGTEVCSKKLSPDEFLTTKELMQLFKIKHRQTVYDLIKDGLPVILIGRSYRFVKEEVLQFLKRHAKKRFSVKRNGDPRHE
ncbi:helix-turn-helix domain-containing protein [Omnitrophica bacterium]|nr:helix-turn-helix domain-containing protein [Candidatus Omnitrophota bacterium]